MAVFPLTLFTSFYLKVLWYSNFSFDKVPISHSFNDQPSEVSVCRLDRHSFAGLDGIDPHLQHLAYRLPLHLLQLVTVPEKYPGVMHSERLQG